MISQQNETVPFKEIVESLSDNVIFSRKFLEERKVFLWGVVTDESAREVVNRLLYLEAQQPGEPIRLLINSPGGSVTAGLIICDTIRMIASPVYTICMGMAASMGAIILSVGQKGQRSIFPSGEVMIHQPGIGGSMQGKSIDIEIQAKQLMKSKQLGARILAENCGHPIEKIIRDFDRDYWMDAQESIDYGIVDRLADGKLIGGIAETGLPSLLR
jgi:ATP-dependent Clp protease protease subunit